MVYRISTILLATSPDLASYQRGDHNAKLLHEWGEETDYQPEPGDKLVRGIPPWGHFYLFEIDAPFPEGANPTPAAFANYKLIELNGNLLIIDNSSADLNLQWLADFFREQFPDQLK